MRKVFSIILSVLFAISLIVSLNLFVLRNNISTDVIIDSVSNLRTSSYVFYDNYLGRSKTDIVRTSKIDDITNQIINGDGIHIDSDKEKVLNDILNDKEIDDFISNYSKEIIDYLTGKSTELNIDKDEINNKINEAIDRYEEESGEVVDRSEINDSIEKIIDDADSLIDTIKDVKPVTTIVNVILGDFIFYLLITVDFSLAIIILLINKSFWAMLKYLSIPAMIVGVLLFVNGFFVGLIDISEISLILNGLRDSYIITGIVVFLLGIVSLLMGKISDNVKIDKKLAKI